MSRRALPHGACLFRVRWATNRKRIPFTTFATRALHGTQPSEQQEEAGTNTSPTAFNEQHHSGFFGSLPARTAVGRVGQGLLVAIPVLGAGFATHLARKDYRRARSELKLAHVRLALAEMNHQRHVSRSAGEQDGVALPTRPILDTSAARSFGVTAAIDSGIVIAHMVTLYGLYQGWEPDLIVNAGIAAMVAAGFSTAGGVRGEYLVARRELSKSGAKGSTVESEDGSKGESGGYSSSTSHSTG